ncbi:MAG: hypothetical protein ABR499_02425 [Gemmatimonadaceae bacterium]
MSDRETTKHDEADESAEDRRSRRSAREVAEWEAALASGKEQGSPARPADADHANAGAIVSRAHRAEKDSGHARDAARPGDWPADAAE